MPRWIGNSDVALALDGSLSQLRQSLLHPESVSMNIRTAAIQTGTKELRVRDAARAVNLADNVTEAAQAAELRARVERVAAVAAMHAAAVDSESRFPREAIAAARAERLLSIAVPRELGGEGLGVADVVDVCYALGRACASTR